ncbi:MAG: site-specific DNA-methyltransferase [Candidatus Thorarchaeota archaeon]
MVNLEWNGKSNQKLSEEKNLSLELIEYINSPLNDKLEKNASVEGKREWENILILGDNKLVMQSLLHDFKSKINLIYFDPPFATGGDFNLKILIGEISQPTGTQRWINKVAYNDTWKGGIDAYLSFMYERLLLMSRLLSDSGSIYVHLDWHMVHYLKIIMDEIFGADNFRNEIIWAYPAASVQTKNFFVRSFDAILFYTKSNDYLFNDDPNIYMEYSDRVKSALKKDEKGIYYHRGGSHNGKKLSQKVYIKKKGVFPRDVWNDIPYVRANTVEYQGFSTQKPERLLKRIILASTNNNDLVADFFCGSGTTLVAAEKLDRRWIGCDSSKFSVNMTYKRIIDIGNGNDLLNWKKSYSKKAKPFKLYRLNEKKTEYQIPIEFTSIKKNNGDLLDIPKNPSFKADIINEQNKFFIELKGYTIPYKNLISEEIKEKILNWSDWIDYWAIDVNNQEKVFIPSWISYRTPKNRTLILKAGPFEFKNSLSNKIMIKTYDILGIEIFQKFNFERE